mmetsp:Transcript_25254/g.56936  ORF Transcript_25254/g.56936 Transcript_25254/m.56936 type:complete len:86 (+) Transcript_25254:912-1169(+)
MPAVVSLAWVCVLLKAWYLASRREAILGVTLMAYLWSDFSTTMDSAICMSVTRAAGRHCVMPSCLLNGRFLQRYCSSVQIAMTGS